MRPLLVPCPRCGASAGDPCQQPNGDRLEWVHAVRRSAAVEQRCGIDWADPDVAAEQNADAKRAERRERNCVP